MEFQQFFSITFKQLQVLTREPDLHLTFLQALADFITKNDSRFLENWEIPDATNPKSAACIQEIMMELYKPKKLSDVKGYKTSSFKATIVNYLGTDKTPKRSLSIRRGDILSAIIYKLFELKGDEYMPKSQILLRGLAYVSSHTEWLPHLTLPLSIGKYFGFSKQAPEPIIIDVENLENEHENGNDDNEMLLNKQYVFSDVSRVELESGTDLKNAGLANIVPSYHAIELINKIQINQSTVDKALSKSDAKIKKLREDLETEMERNAGICEQRIVAQYNHTLQKLKIAKDEEAYKFGTIIQDRKSEMGSNYPFNSDEMMLECDEYFDMLYCNPNYKEVSDYAAMIMKKFHDRIAVLQNHQTSPDSQLPKETETVTNLNISSSSTQVATSSLNIDHEPICNGMTNQINGNLAKKRKIQDKEMLDYGSNLFPDEVEYIQSDAN